MSVLFSPGCSKWLIRFSDGFVVRVDPDDLGLHIREVCRLVPEVWVEL